MADLADIYGGDASFNPSLFAAIEQGLIHSRHEPAVVVRHQAAGHLSDIVERGEAEANDCIRWTFDQLHKAAVRVAKGLLDAGVPQGSIIVTFTANNAEWLLLLWALALAKIGVSSLDPGSLSPARRGELASYLTGVKPSAIILGNEQGTKVIDDMLKECKLDCKIKILFQGQQNKVPGWTTLTQMTPSYPAADDSALSSSARTDDPNRIAFILYTSGTSSGKPKGCPRTTECVVVSTLNQHFQKPGRTKSVRRLLHTANFRVIAPLMTMRAWSTGACIVMPGPGFQPRTALDAIEQERVTDSLFIPAQLHALAADPSIGERDLSCVDLIMSGGDIVTRALIQKSRGIFPNAGWMTGHGMTEGGGFFQWDFWDREDKLPCHGDISALGRVNKCTRLRINQDGRTVKRGETGELQIQSPGVISEYLGGTNADSWVTDDQGTWFRTGDLGMIDKDSYVYILGRLKDIIKRAAVTLTPAAIESCLQAFTGTQVCYLALIIWGKSAD